MKRLLFAAFLLFVPLCVPSAAHAQMEEQALVDRATISLQEMMTQTVSQEPRWLLARARATLICPRIFKAGFFFAGSGGNCVLAARAGNGTWSYPAFFTIGSASFGLQIGLQDSSLVLLVLTNRGLDALLNSHFKLGADASIAVVTIGGGAQGALTTGLTADIVAFSEARGAFIGISLEGSVLNSRTDMNQAYYGRPLDARQIVIAMQAANPGADPLRAMLTRYGAPGAVAATPAYGYAPPQGYAPPASGYQSGYQGGYQPQAGSPPGYAAPAYPPAGAGGPIPLQPGGGIQQQNLPPPR